MRIPLIPGLILGAIALVINTASCIIIFILSIPSNFWKSLTASLSLMLATFPQSVRAFLKLYDANGLRHNISHLNNNGTRKKIAVATLKEQCQYVDNITRSMFPKNPKPDKRTGDKKPGYMPLFPLPGAMQSLIPIPPITLGPIHGEMDMRQINTTSIGNMAWVSLYHPSEDHRNYCNERLQEIRDYFITMA